MITDAISPTYTYISLLRTKVAFCFLKERRVNVETLDANKIGWVEIVKSQSFFLITFLLLVGNLKVR